MRCRGLGVVCVSEASVLWVGREGCGGAEFVAMRGLGNTRGGGAELLVK